MAITNAQQFKQLVNPRIDKKRPGYRGDDAYGGGGDKSGNNNGGNNDARDRAMGLQGKTGVTDKSLDTGGGFGNVDRSKVGQFSTYGKNLMTKNLTPPSMLSKIGGGIKNYITQGGLIGLGIRGLQNIFGGPKGFSTQGDPYGMHLAVCGIIVAQMMTMMIEVEEMV